MITIEMDKASDAVDIILDAQGVDEMITYLNFIKDKKDHMHLCVGNELGDSSITKGSELVKFVTLIYSDE